MSTAERFPEIISEYSKDFRRIFLAGIYGHVSQSGLEAVVYSEETYIDEVLKTPGLNKEKVKIKRIAECNMIIDPSQMKAIHNWLGEKIEEYEHIFGDILPPDQIVKKLESWNLKSKGQLKSETE